MTFQPFTEKKCWGEVTHIFASPHAAVSCLRVDAGQRCSCHLHFERANQFTVLEGSIVVEWWEGGFYGRKRIKMLTPSEVFAVPSFVPHRFRVIESGKVVEVYWADRGGEVRMNDIHRKDVGGPDDLDELKREVLAAGLEWPPDVKGKE